MTKRCAIFEFMLGHFSMPKADPADDQVTLISEPRLYN